MVKNDQNWPKMIKKSPKTIFFCQKWLKMIEIDKPINKKEGGFPPPSSTKQDQTLYSFRHSGAIDIFQRIGSITKLKRQWVTHL